VVTWLVDYCSVADVKPLLNLDLQESSEDLDGSTAEVKDFNSHQEARGFKRI
jgi:hypothetical protein